jgi:Fe(3+) dicitrate transport protein
MFTIKSKSLLFFISFISIQLCIAKNLPSEIKANNLLELDSTLKNVTIPTLEIIELKNNSKRLDENKFSENVLLKARKVEIISVNATSGNLVTNSARQIFSSIPGIQIWEQDATQVGIATRGFSPNRSWEFNVRQNGYDISADPLGYPEAYFTPAFEALEKIEFIRGSASLAFGPQPGGMVNYVVRGNKEKKLYGQIAQTAGSFGLLGSFAQIGFNKGKWSFNSYLQYRTSNGYRKNSNYTSLQYFTSLAYQISNNWNICAELSGIDYKAKQAGGLTDVQFVENPQQSNRNRNWMSLPWLVPSVKLNYLNDSVHSFCVNVFSLNGERNSVGFVRAINIKDEANADGVFSNRQVDKDLYLNFGTEARYNYTKKLEKSTHTISSGLRYFNGTTKRQQLAIGTNASDLDFELVNPSVGFNRELNFLNTNLAAYLEYNVELFKKLNLRAGARAEHVNSIAKGRIGYDSNGNELAIAKTERTRNFILPAFGVEYKINKDIKIYGNASSFYRPVMFSDLTPASLLDSIDQNLMDANGYNYDLGIKGKIGKYFYLDFSGFWVEYKNRIGNLPIIKSNGSTAQFRSNLGESVSKGIELYTEYDLMGSINKKSKLKFTPFLSLTFMEAVYSNFEVSTTVNEKATILNLAGKRIENAPKFICRTGFNLSYEKLCFNLNFAYTEKTFSDALNTETPTANAQNGLIPAYRIWDFTTSYTFTKNWSLNCGINNLSNQKYFTRRAGGYPGPGILAADGRNFFVSGRFNF